MNAFHSLIDLLMIALALIPIYPTHTQPNYLPPGGPYPPGPTGGPPFGGN